MSAVARRYARAIAETISEQKADGDTLLQDLEKFAQAYAQVSALRELLHHPQLKAQSTSAMDAVLQKMGLSQLAQRILGLLSENNRITLLPQLIVELQERLDREKGRLRARVRSPIVLTAAHQERIAHALSQKMRAQVSVQVEIDTTLLGGFICHVGDVVFDSSLNRQLEVLREQLETSAI